MSINAVLRLHENNSGALAPQEIPLTKKFTHIGRAIPSIKSDENKNEIDCVTLTLRIQDADIISRKHATITMIKSSDGSCRYSIADLGSINGLFINRKRIKEQVLKDGDIVQFGGRGNLPFGAMIVRPEANIQYIFQSVVEDELSRGGNDTGLFSGQVRNDKGAAVPTSATTPVQLSSVAAHVAMLTNFSSTTTATGVNTSMPNPISATRLDPSLKDFEASSLKRKHTKTGSLMDTPSSTNQENTGSISVHNKEISLLKANEERLTKSLNATEQTLSDNNKRAAREKQELEKQKVTLQELLKKSVDEKSALELKLRTQEAKISVLQSEVQSARKKKNTSGKPSPVSPDLISVIEETKNSGNKKHVVINDKVLKRYEIYAKSQMSTIDVSALHSSLNCRSCSQIFVSPVTLLCSHTYCRACIEQQWAKYRCYGVCVTCDDPRDKKHRCNSDVGQNRRIYLSTETLDNVIWLLLEALPEKDRIVSVSLY